MFDLVHLNGMIVNDERKRNAGKETEGGRGWDNSHQAVTSFGRPIRPWRKWCCFVCAAQAQLTFIRYFVCYCLSGKQHYEHHKGMMSFVCTCLYEWMDGAGTGKSKALVPMGNAWEDVVLFWNISYSLFSLQFPFTTRSASDKLWETSKTAAGYRIPVKLIQITFRHIFSHFWWFLIKIFLISNLWFNDSDEVLFIIIIIMHVSFLGNDRHTRSKDVHRECHIHSLKWAAKDVIYSRSLLLKSMWTLH